MSSTSTSKHPRRTSFLCLCVAFIKLDKQETVYQRRPNNITPNSISMEGHGTARDGHETACLSTAFAFTFEGRSWNGQTASDRLRMEFGTWNQVWASVHFNWRRRIFMGGSLLLILLVAYRTCTIICLKLHRLQNRQRLPRFKGPGSCIPRVSHAIFPAREKRSEHQNVTLTRCVSIRPQATVK